jgi:hypothetical protein
VGPDESEVASLVPVIGDDMRRRKLRVVLAGLAAVGAVEFAYEASRISEHFSCHLPGLAVSLKLTCLRSV